MNERYLFKAKKTENGEWVEGYYVKGMDMYEKETQVIFKPDTMFYSHGETDGFIEIDPSTVCQCTGLKDKNEKLIWENDIIKKEFYQYPFVHENPKEIIGVVKYEDCAWNIRYVDSCGKYKYTYPICVELAESHDAEHYDVIGNAFDNPELLESEE